MKKIEEVTIEKEIKQVYYEKETTKHNEIVIKSNDIVLVTE